MAARRVRRIENPSASKALLRMAACATGLVLLYHRDHFLPLHILWVKIVSGVITAGLTGHIIWEIYIAVIEILLATDWVGERKKYHKT